MKVAQIHQFPDFDWENLETIYSNVDSLYKEIYNGAACKRKKNKIFIRKYHIELTLNDAQIVKTFFLFVGSILSLGIYRPIFWDSF